MNNQTFKHSLLALSVLSALHIGTALATDYIGQIRTDDDLYDGGILIPNSDSTIISGTIIDQSYSKDTSDTTDDCSGCTGVSLILDDNDPDSTNTLTIDRSIIKSTGYVTSDDPANDYSTGYYALDVGSTLKYVDGDSQNLPRYNVLPSKDKVLLTVNSTYMDGLVHVASSAGGSASFSDSVIDFTAKAVSGEYATVSPLYAPAALAFDGEDSTLSVDHTLITSHTLDIDGLIDYPDNTADFDGIDVSGNGNTVTITGRSSIDAAATGLSIAGDRTTATFSNSFITAATDGILMNGTDNSLHVSDGAAIDAQQAGIRTQGQNTQLVVEGAGTQVNGANTGIRVEGSTSVVTISSGATVSGPTAVQLADTATDVTLKVEGATVTGETALDIATTDAADVSFSGAQVNGAIRSSSSADQRVTLSQTAWSGEAVSAGSGALDMVLSASTWEGSAPAGDGSGAVSVTLTDGAQWTSNADSVVSDVNMDGGTTLVMDGGNVNTQTLTGGSDNVAMIYSTYNAATESASLLTAETASGIFGTAVASGTSGSAGDMTGDTIVHVTDASNATFKSSVSDVGVYRYATITVANTDGSTDVVLADADDAPPVPPDPDDGGNTPDPDDGGNTPSHHTLSTAAQSVVNTRAAAVNLWRDEEEALVRQMDSERRQDTTEGSNHNGAWGSYYGGYHRQQMNESSTSFDQTNNGFMVGADMRTETASGHWLTGFAVMRGYANINMHDAGSAGTTSDSYGAALYAAWRADNGVFVDGTLKGEHVKNDMDVVSTDGGYAHGNYSTNGYGASLRAGYHWAATPALWAEPYAKVSYIRYNGVDYRLSNDLRAKDDDYTSLRVEGGANVGTMLQAGSVTLKPYLHLAVADETEGDNIVDINGVQVDDGTEGALGVVGAGVDVAFTRNLSAQVGANYAKGDDMESPWQVGAGVTWTW